jgi:uncharacterized protein (TIGR04141 family)
MKFTIRLSKPNKTIAALLKPTHNLTGPLSNWNGIADAELYYGMAYSNQPGWINFLSAGTPNPITGLLSSGAIALLFIPLATRYMVFTFGICVSKLSFAGFERDFGLKVVLNTVDPGRIKSVDSKTIDTIITNRRTQLSKENKIQDFGFEIDRDLLGSVIGKPSNQHFASVVGGYDALSLNCNVTPTGFFQKCQDILNAYTSTVYKTNYAWIDNIKPVKDQSIIDVLDAELVMQVNALLQGNPAGDLQIASPTILDFQVIDHFRFGGYRSTIEFDMPDMEGLVNDLQSKSITVLTQANLEAYRVKAFDGVPTVTQEWPLYDWLITEVTYNQIKYILSEGSWFEISPAYYAKVDTAFQRILHSRAEYKHIGVTRYGNESDYLANYSVTANEIILDRQLVYTYGSNNSIEPCDIYNTKRQFIHVKDGGASSKLSHLFNQGFVSASAFVGDQKFRQDVKSKLATKPHISATITSPLVTNDYTIIYRILKRGTSFNLPFFTKIVVNETSKKIKLMGYKFKLEWVQKV